MEDNPLEGVEALLHDVFGTVVDWRTSVANQLHTYNAALTVAPNEDWVAFTEEWRSGYYQATRHVADQDTGNSNVDLLHRELLDKMLESSRWKHLASLWDEAKRQDIVLFWHRLDGWPDSSEGLHAVKKHVIIGTLSNGSARLLVDMAKHAGLPWDIIFSGDLLGSYKPNPKMYLGAAKHLSLPPEKCAMVAAHIYDLRAAATHGFKTVDVRRSGEDSEELMNSVKTKKDGGDVDVVVDSFVELAEILRKREVMA